MANTDYPRMLFHRTKSPVIVHSREEEDALGQEWSRIYPHPGLLEPEPELFTRAARHPEPEPEPRSVGHAEPEPEKEPLPATPPHRPARVPIRLPDHRDRPAKPAKPEKPAKKRRGNT